MHITTTACVLRAMLRLSHRAFHSAISEVPNPRRRRSAPRNGSSQRGVYLNCRELRFFRLCILGILLVNLLDARTGTKSCVLNEPLSRGLGLHPPRVSCPDHLMIDPYPTVIAGRYVFSPPTRLSSVVPTMTI